MKQSRWLSLLLVVSLGFNIFFLGMLAARRVPAWVHGGHRRGAPGAELEHGGPMFAVRSVVRVMGGRGDPRVRAIWEKNRALMRERGGRVAAAQHALIATLAQQPYSEPAAEQALRRTQAEVQAVTELAHGSLLELAQKLTPEERRQLARQLEKRHDMPPKLR